MEFEYGEKYKDYDMSKIIRIGGGTLKVHDLMNPLPDFMKEADCIFIDPPCSRGNLNTFYTKAKLDERVEYENFARRIWECIDEINPKYLFIETFKSNREQAIEEMKKRYPYVYVNENTYYHNKNYHCWIVQGSHDSVQYDLNGIDEIDAVPVICEKVPFECIGDICMGQGLVGRSAYKNHKRFVGTELNYKRLAVLVDWLVKEGENIE